jgi:hypothetical protein
VNWLSTDVSAPFCEEFGLLLEIEKIQQDLINVQFLILNAQSGDKSGFPGIEH